MNTISALRRVGIPIFCLLSVLSFLSASRGAIVFSGDADIPIPLTFDGVYLNPLTGATAASQPADWNTAPWLNPFFGGVYLATDALLRPSITGTDRIVNLAFNAIIDGFGNYAGDESGSSTHFGPAADQFQNGIPGYIGFRFEPFTGGATHYGWAQIKISNTGSGEIISWAYDDVPGNGVRAGVVPEPAACLLISGIVGCTALRRWRRNPPVRDNA